jgi:hypothetical protein
MGASGNSGSVKAGSDTMRMGTGVNGKAGSNPMGNSGVNSNTGSNAIGNTNPCPPTTAGAAGNGCNNLKSP